MKKYFKFLVLALAVTFPAIVKADVDKFNVSADNDVKIDETINGSSVSAGNNVTSASTVKGINMLFGNNIDAVGNSDYALFAGNNVNVDGQIKNDGAIFGNLITLKNNFVTYRDLLIMGNEVNLHGHIGRDVTIYANEVVLDTVIIDGNINIYAQKIEIKEIVAIGGTLSYTEDADITINANIANVEKLPAVQKNIMTFENIMYAKLIAYTMTVVTFLGLGLIIPGLFKRISKKYEEAKAVDFLSTIGFGALGLIGIPFAFVMLCITVFGLPIAFLLLAVYIIVLLMTTIFAGYLIGHYICKLIIKKDLHHLLVGLIGITVLSLIVLIPFIGTFVAFISVMLSIGVVLRLFKRD